MKWTDQIFHYCERGSDPTFWGEPLNAISNAAFILAGVAAAAQYARLPARDRDIATVVLIMLVFVIGIGSFLFHTFATRWSAFADSAPIALFMLVYLGFALGRYLHGGWLVIAFGGLAFMAAGSAVALIRCGHGPCFNGSLGYLPALLAMVAVGGLLAIRRQPAATGLFAAAAVFVLSLTLRSIDNSICPFTLVQPNWRTGTHALWHVLNAVVLYTLLRVAIRHGRPRIQGKLVMA